MAHPNATALVACMDRNMKLANAISQDMTSDISMFYKQLL